MARRASIAELKARLSEYVAMAKNGDDVLITERGRPVAKLVPLSGELAEEGRLAELVRGGLVRPPRTRLTARFLRERRPPDPEGRSLQSVLEERVEGA